MIAQSALFVKHLSRALNDQCQGNELIRIYSNSKTQLVIEIDTQEDLGKYWVIDFSTGKMMIHFPEKSFNPSRGYLLQFQSAHQQTIQSVNWIKNDRSLMVHLQNGEKIYLCFYGRRADIMHAQEKGMLKSFRKQISHAPVESPLQIDAPSWEDFFKLNRFLPSKTFKRNYSSTDAQEYYHNYFNQNIHFSEGDIELSNISTPSPQWLQDLSQYSRQYLKFYHLQRKEKEHEQRLAKYHKTIRQRLAKAQNKLLSLEISNKYQSWADIIMSNLGSIEPGINKQSLMDHLNQSLVEITFNPKLSPVENANKYYQKAKNAHKELQFLKDKIAQLKLELEKTEAPPIQEIQEKQMALPYWEFEHNDFEIRIGKSAEKNDELLRHHTHKNDLWLHAKDVSGSHVIIRNPNKKAIPKETLEYAASLAAKYSKSHGHNLAAVIYTPRKYVRKNKKLLTGQVILDQEEVILVKPAE